MLAEVIDGHDVITVHLPRHLMVAVAVHRLFLISGFWDGASIDLRLAPHKPDGRGLLGRQEQKCGAGLLGFIYQCERGKVL